MAHRNEQQGSEQYATRRGTISCLGWGGRGGLLGFLGACVLLGLSMAPAQGATFAYITNIFSNNMSVIDTATNSVIKTVPVVGAPQGVAANLAGTRVYVTHQGNNTVSVIDTTTLTVIAIVPVGTTPFGVAVNPAGTQVYVANRNDNTVSVIATAMNTVIKTVPVGATPVGVAVNPAGTRVYVTNQSDNTVSVIATATNTVIDTVPVGTTPFGVAVDPAGTQVYVANQNSNNVYVIATATNAVIAIVQVGTAPVAFGQFIALVQPQPSLALALTGCTTCRAGDRFTVQAHVTNPSATNTVVEAKVGVREPDGTPMNLLGECLKVTLSAGLDTTVTVFDITLPAELRTGTWTLEGALLEPALGAILSRSVRFFEVVP